MKERINLAIKKCVQCQVQGKNTGKTTEIHPLSIPARAFSRWGIDFIEPLIQSRKARYLHEANSENVATLLYEDLMLVF
ncbi:hypothetical protein AYI68_g114 [Smittium mucronatum]|uniref:Integrase zinc-binding domain-containing protein n=1 Tax=Smittium mucronatum TaxID=133383 RepID=A0A1R0H955_9FUNG|nr:hypothetical protein AYI68_g114 [Smittium mucronatum]